MKKAFGMVSAGCMGLIMAMFIGCGLVDPTSTPEIKISSIGTINAGTFQNVTGEVKADEEITNIKYTILDSDDNEVTTITVEGPSAANEKKINFSGSNAIKITVPSNATDGTYQLKISVTAGDATTDGKFAFEVSGGSTGTPITTATVTIGSLSNATTGSSVDLDAGTVLTAGSATASGSGVDLVGTYSTSKGSFRLFNPVYAKNGSGIAAFANWVSPNDTKFHKVSVTFASIETAEAIEALFDAARAESAFSCATGDVFVVKTDLGKYVLVELGAFDANTSGTATIKYGK